MLISVDSSDLSNKITKSELCLQIKKKKTKTENGNLKSMNTNLKELFYYNHKTRGRKGENCIRSHGAKQ